MKQNKQNWLALLIIGVGIILDFDPLTFLFGILVTGAGILLFFRRKKG